ncbi:restriction endonuclease subunit S [Weissella paramesenteroides]
MGMQPKLRFKGFTDDWEKRKLGDVSSSFEYGLNAASKKFDGKHKYIRITDIDDETHLFSKSNLTSPDINLDKAIEYMLRPNDILFARTGASVGKTYKYIQTDGEVYFAGFLIRATISKDNDVDFIYQHTLTNKYKNFIKVTSQRSGQPGVNAKEFRTFEIMIPKHDEQQKVGDLLKTFDQLITVNQRKVDLLKKKKAGYLQKLFPRNGQNKPELRFKGYTDAWEKRKLESIFKERTERSSEGTMLSVTINDGVVLANSLSRKNVSSSDKSNYKLVRKDDIAYNSMRMWQSASGVSNYEGIVSPAYTVLIPEHDVNSSFFGYYFKRTVMKQVFQKNSQGLTSDTWNLKYPLLKNIVVQIPSIEEQIKISEFLKQVDKLIAVNQRKVDLLKKRKSHCFKKCLSKYNLK